MSNRSRDCCSVDLRVRYAECDAMGHLHHARYWEYFEHARTELLRRNGFRYRDLEADGVFFVVYRAACKYLAPIRYDEVVTVHVRVTRVTPTRVEHAYIIERDGRTTSEASSTLACVGRNGRPQAMPRALWTEQPACRAPAAD
ncbi:MAG: acyl-CoA thioesterase [Gemmatimonadetes bacterium]|nr:acyl-CoA thioesterase [Gemmatimonadota bacterium]